MQYSLMQFNLPLESVFQILCKIHIFEPNRVHKVLCLAIGLRPTSINPSPGSKVPNQTAVNSGIHLNAQGLKWYYI